MAFGFVVGFFAGAYPEKILQFSGQKPKHLYLIFSDEKQVPMSLLLDFEKSTGVSFTAKVINSYFVFQSEAQKADLIFVPFSWFENALPTMIESPAMEDFTSLLSADFISLSLSSNHFLPVFWKVGKKSTSTTPSELLLWGFAIGKKKADTDQNSYALISYLIQDPARMRTWMNQVGLASSLKMSDSLNGIDENLKAKKLRDHPLSQLSIQRLID